MLTQTIAIFVDAYRELNARRLFWITLVLSVMVVAVFAAMGNNDRGLTVLHWTIEFPPVSTDFVPRDQFYKMLFVRFGLAFWLTWVATILALISTASIFPDFLAGGAIELTLSKPIGRLRLFLTKYLAGLLFVTLQVGVFTAACFVLIGVRGGSWEPAVLLAVPIVVLVFSYLFCVCVLIGVLWRSTIAALLLTMLVWFGIFLVNSADAVLLMLSTRQTLVVQQQTQAVERLRATVASLEARAAGDAGPSPPPAPEASPAPALPETGGLGGALREALRRASAPEPTQDEAAARLVRERERLERAERRLSEVTASRRNFAQWHGIVFAAKTILPKTGETTGLMERYIIDLAGLENLAAQKEPAQAPQAGFGAEPDESPVDDEQVARAVDKVMKSRSERWVIGTSLLFQVVVLGAAAWVFCRRDF